MSSEFISVRAYFEHKLVELVIGAGNQPESQRWLKVDRSLSSDLNELGMARLFPFFDGFMSTADIPLTLRKTNPQNVQQMAESANI